MYKNQDRWHNISNKLNNIGVSYSRVEAIDGFNINNNKDAKVILKCRTPLLNSNFKCKTFQQEWLYDGTINSSFPGLNRYGNEGAKGLIISNIKAFQICIKINNDYILGLNDNNYLDLINYNSIINNSYYKYNWFCILEDDAIIDNAVYNEILNFLKDNQEKDIILLDKRIGGGAAGVLYNSKIIPKIIEELHPLSDFSINMEDNYNCATLWDWKLWNYVNYSKDLKFTSFPIIESGGYDSTIDIIN
jgi:hypothetical protein